tara:strand:- start:792 stop:1571 length:780 start_codon:yes stop_codon:yes gene_type:complete
MTLITKDFSTGYRNNEIIKSINITLRNKEWLGIIGPNGSGKSTFLKGISRILKPTSGHAFINEYDIHLSSSNDIAKEISILPQLQTLDLQMSVYELVCLGRSPHKKWWQPDLNREDLIKVDQSLALTEMSDLKNKAVGTLSGGQRQRAFLSLALAQDAKTLLLDEPTTFLDLHYQLQLLDLLKRLNQDQKLSIITIIHDVNLAARYCDRIAVFKDGELIAQDETSKVLTRELMKEAFQVETCQIETPIGLQICTIKSYQ